MSRNGTAHFKKYKQWKGINCEQSTRWQHLSRLKASAFFSLQKILVVIKTATYTWDWYCHLVADRASLFESQNFFLLRDIW